MSSVQVSVGSSGAARGSFPQHARRSVCRSLFGPVDHDELNRYTEDKLREISDRDQKRWNFNFGSGTPLLGDYEWEVETAPEFYQESVQVGKRRAVAAVHCNKPRAEAPYGENDAVHGAAVSPERARAGTPGCTRRKRVVMSTSARLTTSRVTDFYVKRRKQDVKQCERVPHEKPFSSLGCEQTPRKRLR